MSFADIIVVGGGVVGKAITLSLARSGIAVTCIDRAEESDGYRHWQREPCSASSAKSPLMPSAKKAILSFLFVRTPMISMRNG